MVHRELESYRVMQEQIWLSSLHTSFHPSSSLPLVLAHSFPPSLSPFISLALHSCLHVSTCLPISPHLSPTYLYSLF